MRRPHLSDASPFKLDWVSQKCFDGSCPLGPWIVPASDIPDPQKLAMKLWVNGELMQDSHTSQMIFSTAEQIAQLCTRVTLRPGDLVFTGIPAFLPLSGTREGGQQAVHRQCLDARPERRSGWSLGRRSMHEKTPGIETAPGDCSLSALTYFPS